MKPNTKDNPIIVRVVITLVDIEGMTGEFIKKGTECIIIRELGDVGEHSYYVIKSHCGIRFYPVKDCDITDDFSFFIITHYECIKDGKVILSSDEPIEAESIEEFKENAKRLIQCDTINVEFEKIGE